jgi:ABC-type dipeptide/oligopeptide/nickel transport system ATPase subunit
MPAIQVNNLSKTFRTKHKAAGLGASLWSLFRPEYKNVESVRGLSFEMESGELLGFMGAVPAGFVMVFSWSSLGLMLLGAAGFLAMAILVFNAGLRLYESGSAIQTEV